MIALYFAERFAAKVEPHVEEAIRFLRGNEPPEGYLVGFSGGKDSIVALALVRLSGVKYEAWHSCTRLDPPEVYKFIRRHYPEVLWAYPKESLWSAIKRKSPPLRLRRWCCDLLKKNPLKDHPLKHRVMGIRADESTRRAARPRVDFHDHYKQWTYKPIFNWTDEMVWDFIDSRNLAYPSLYDEGFGRVGCCWCPFLMCNNQTRLKRHMKRWPGIYKAFEHTIRNWWTPNKIKNERFKTDTVEEFLAEYYRGFDAPSKKYPEGSQQIRCLNDVLQEAL